MSNRGHSSDPFSKRAGRRLVQLRAYVVKADKEIIDVSIGDLSYSGCAVHTDTPLHPGETVLLSVLGRGGGKAVVRWYKDRKAGLEFEPEEVPREHIARSSHRKLVAAEVLLRRSAHPSYRVRVFDVSPSGCRCEFVERPSIGERVWVKFDQLEALEAEVRWLQNACAGLQFINPIHPAVFHMMQQRFA